MTGLTEKIPEDCTCPYCGKEIVPAKAARTFLLKLICGSCGAVVCGFEQAMGKGRLLAAITGMAVALPALWLANRIWIFVIVYALIYLLGNKLYEMYLENAYGKNKWIPVSKGTERNLNKAKASALRSPHILKARDQTREISAPLLYIFRGISLAITFGMVWWTLLEIYSGVATIPCKYAACSSYAFSENLPMYLVAISAKCGFAFFAATFAFYFKSRP